MSCRRNDQTVDEVSPHFFKLLRRRRDQDVPFSQIVKTETRQDVHRQDQDVPKNISRPQCRSLETLTGEVCHLTTCLRVSYSVVTVSLFSRSVGVCRCFREKVGGLSRFRYLYACTKCYCAVSTTYSLTLWSSR